MSIKNNILLNEDWNKHIDNLVDPRCSKCHKPNERFPRRYCLDCHAEYMRGNRTKYVDFTPDQKRKADCRSYSKALEERGILIRQPCENCSDPEVERHHEDYDDPYNVTWLCRVCHLNLHDAEREPG